MKKFLAYSVLASVLLFTGCSQKSTEMNEAKMNKTEKSSESNLDAMNANNMNQDSMSDSESMTANAIKNLLIDVVYFDFAKAFDTVNHDIILHKLKHQFGIDGRLLRFIAEYLKGRKQAVLCGVCSFHLVSSIVFC